MNERFIPQSVCDLMTSDWQDKTGTTESIAGSSANRVLQPANYFIHNTPPSDNDITHAEATALHLDAAFGVGSRLNDKGVVVINEHAKHSLEEFLGEVTLAWHRHQERLKKLAKLPKLSELP